jgi:hypothetical protein
MHAKSECCPDPKPMVVYLGEVANVDELLRDKNKNPNFEWAETFATLFNNQIQIYTDEKFKVADATFFYYKQPRHIQIANVTDPYTGLTPAIDVLSEFKDDLVEVFIDEAVKIIAGDIESMTQVSIAAQRTEQNN